MMQPAHALSSACGARTQHTLLLPRGAYWQQPRLQRPVRPRRTAAASNAAATATPAPTPPAPAPSSSSNAAAAHTWRWRGSRAVFYERTGRGPIPVVLVHGMGACHEHWRRLVDVLDVDALYTVYALDLVGFGDSERPAPGHALPPGHTAYCFDAWAAQLTDFVEQVVGVPALLVGNSAGGLAALQAAVAAPHLVRGLVLLDCSLRRQHVRNQHPLLHPFVAALQWALARTPLGHAAVDWVLHQPGRLARILGSAYADPSQLSPQLLAAWTAHLAAPGTRDVLLDVITNSSGPLPQDLLPQNTVPTMIIWGGADPWEPVQVAQSVFCGCGWPLQFAVLPGVGHFPHDEAPELVAQLLDEFAADVVATECEGGGSSAAAAAAREDGCAAVWEQQPGPTVAGFPLRGLMAAAELDAKV